MIPHERKREPHQATTQLDFKYADAFALLHYGTLQRQGLLIHISACCGECNVWFYFFVALLTCLSLFQDQALLCLSLSPFERFNEK